MSKSLRITVRHTVAACLFAYSVPLLKARIFDSCS